MRGIAVLANLIGALIIADLGTPAGVSNPVSQARGQPGHWPGWRGPNRDNISTETGLLKKWPEGGPPLVWQVQGIGQGIASVAVAQGRVFTLGYRDKSEIVTSLDAGSGERLWAT